MRPNFKKLAEEYREKNHCHEATIARLYQDTFRAKEALRKIEREVEEWKLKYADLLDRHIALQERMKEGK